MNTKKLKKTLEAIEAAIHPDPERRIFVFYDYECMATDKDLANFKAEKGIQASDVILRVQREVE